MQSCEQTPQLEVHDPTLERSAVQMKMREGQGLTNADAR